MPLSSAQTTRFNPIGLGMGLYRGFNALQGIQQQGLTRSTGLSGLGAGLGLLGAFPGLSPQMSGGLQAGGQIGSLLSSLSAPGTLQALRNFPSGGVLSPANPKGGGLSAGLTAAGGALGLGSTLAGLSGADPRLSMGLGVAGNVASAAPYFIPGTAAGTTFASVFGGGAGAAAGATGGGAVAGGTAAAGSAAGTGVMAGAGAAMAAIAPVMALYAIGTTLGGMREQAIEERYGKGAKEGLSNFTASPSVQGIGQNLTRFQSGDMSVLPQIQDALLQAFRTQDALNQPAGSTGIGILPFTQGIFDVLKRNPGAYNSVLAGLADSFIPSRDRAMQDPAEFLSMFGFLPRPPTASPLPPPTDPFQARATPAAQQNVAVHQARSAPIAEQNFAAHQARSTWIPQAYTR